MSEKKIAWLVWMEAFCRGKKSRAEPYPCKQRTAFGTLAHHICVALQHKEVRTGTIPTKTKQRGHRFGVLLFWLPITALIRTKGDNHL